MASGTIKLKMKNTCVPFKAQLEISFHLEAFIDQLTCCIVLFIGDPSAPIDPFETMEKTQL